MQEDVTDELNRDPGIFSLISPTVMDSPKNIREKMFTEQGILKRVMPDKTEK